MPTGPVRLRRVLRLPPEEVLRVCGIPINSCDMGRQEPLAGLVGPGRPR